jgi:hypothetical protein
MSPDNVSCAGGSAPSGSIMPLDLSEALPFFKALSDESRLRIIGLLAAHPHTVEQLAEALRLRPSTVSHHLTRLAAVGLVSARAESYYNIYRLENKALATMVGIIRTTVRQAPAPTEFEGPVFDRRVLRTYLDEEGRLKALPSQAKKRLAILRHMAALFEHGQRYSEKQVNAILKGISHEHYVTLRRYLVDYGFMGREGGGGEYWLNE